MYLSGCLSRLYRVLMCCFEYPAFYLCDDRVSTDTGVNPGLVILTTALNTSNVYHSHLALLDRNTLRY